MNKLSPFSFSVEINKTLSGKGCMIAAATAALVVSVAFLQPAQAKEAVGQMVDDTGLVIRSYSDGSVKEFQPSDLVNKKYLWNTSKSTKPVTVITEFFLGDKPSVGKE